MKPRLQYLLFHFFSCILFSLVFCFYFSPNCMQLHKWQPVFPQRAALAGEELLTAVATAVPLLPLVPPWDATSRALPHAARCKLLHILFFLCL